LGRRLPQDLFPAQVHHVYAREVPAPLHRL